jgi:polyisoprenoid-binding protein YceI
MPKWIIDPDHSVGAFSIGHLMVAHVHGQMNNVTGTISFDPPDVAGLTVEFEIGVRSILTGIQKRDDHLKSQDFFHADENPKITFKSSKAERTGFTSCKVSGDITIHGITRPLTLEVEVLGPVKSPFGETSIGISGRTVLNREDFGMTWNESVEGGGFMVGKDAEVSVDLEADLAEE